MTVDTPAAAVTTSPATVVAPGTAVSFDATGSTDPEGTIIDYSWNFGDGTPVDDAGTSTSIQRAYASRGTYTVTLTVTNDFGQTNTTTHTLTVDDPPTAAFTPSASVAAPGATVNFNASASAPGASGGTINDYSWNFGDGTPIDDTSGTAAASHAYASPGTYTVTLTTTDDLGVTGTTTEQITVDAPDRRVQLPPTVPAPGSPSASTPAARPTPRARSPTTAGTSATAASWTPAAPRACNSSPRAGASVPSRSR